MSNYVDLFNCVGLFIDVCNTFHNVNSSFPVCSFYLGHVPVFVKYMKSGKGPDTLFVDW